MSLRLYGTNTFLGTSDPTYLRGPITKCASGHLTLPTNEIITFHMPLYAHWATRKNLTIKPIIKRFRWRNVPPTGSGKTVDGIERSNHNIMFVPFKSSVVRICKSKHNSIIIIVFVHIQHCTLNRSP